eukprot:Sdes_comp24262_c0_seq1m22260
MAAKPEASSTSLDQTVIVETNLKTAFIKRRIVLATDNSPQGQHTFLWLLQTYLNTDDHLTLVHCYEPPYGPYATRVWNPYGLGELIPEAKEANRLAEEQHSNCLRMYGRLCQKHNFNNFKMILIRGSPREELVRFTERHPCDTLIIGSHGYGSIKRALLGSVSTYCVHHCKCPVLVVRGTELTQKFQQEYDEFMAELKSRNDESARNSGAPSTQ